MSIRIRDRLHPTYANTVEPSGQPSRTGTPGSFSASLRMLSCSSDKSEIGLVLHSSPDREHRVGEELSSDIVVVMVDRVRQRNAGSRKSVALIAHLNYIEAMTLRQKTIRATQPAMARTQSQLYDRHLDADLSTMVEMEGRLMEDDKTIASKLTKHGPASRLTSCPSSLPRSLSTSIIENVTS